MPHERETADEQAVETAVARQSTGGGLQAVQRALGNAAMGRLLRSAGGAEALRRAADGRGSRMLARWDWPWADKPKLGPTDEPPIEHQFDVTPVVPKLEARAERERTGKHPPTPEKFEAGDHVWYYPHPDPDVPRITADLDVPRDLWFPKSAGPTDYEGHGMEISEFVIYADHVKEGKPHMKGKPGTTAWINNNPGNLSGNKEDVGQIRGKLNWHRFLIFPTPDAGYDAIPKWLKAYGYYTKSILSCMRAYAPASDGNRPDEYAAGIVSALKGEKTADGNAITLDTRLEQLSDDQMTRVQDAIKTAEGTVPGITHPRDSDKLPPEIRKRL